MSSPVAPRQRLKTKDFPSAPLSLSSVPPTTYPPLRPRWNASGVVCGNLPIAHRRQIPTRSYRQTQVSLNLSQFDRRWRFTLASYHSGCPSPPTISHGTLGDFSSNQVDGYWPTNTQVSVKCAKGYLGGDAKSLCLPEGQWSSADCVKPSRPVDSSESDSLPLSLL